MKGFILAITTIVFSVVFIPMSPASENEIFFVASADELNTAIKLDSDLKGLAVSLAFYNSLSVNKRAAAENDLKKFILESWAGQKKWLKKWGYKLLDDPENELLRTI